LPDIIKLRQREEEAFITYRQALNQAIGNFASYNAVFTEQDARALYGDVIAPSLAQLEQKVNQAKRDLIRKPVRSFVGIVGAISFGILTGLVPQNIINIAQTIGLAKFGADILKDMMALGDKEDAIRSDHFYFLWKVKKKAEE
jgi:hypothetical protein